MYLARRDAREVGADLTFEFAHLPPAPVSDHEEEDVAMYKEEFAGEIAHGFRFREQLPHEGGLQAFPGRPDLHGVFLIVHPQDAES